LNSAHDLGGMHGFGAVCVADDEAFGARWESSLMAASIVAAFQGLLGTGDAGRHAIERMGNVEYIKAGYFDRVLAAVSTLLIENGVISEAELAERLEAVRHDPARFALSPASAPDELSGLVTRVMREGGSSERSVDQAPMFAVGDAVETMRRSPRGHTRLPRYARGRRGVVIRHHGAHVLPDTNAHGLGERPEHLYGVRFEASELWGDAADGRGCVCLDLWESYLE
jgi:nitrile hydratase beta subunit